MHVYVLYVFVCTYVCSHIHVYTYVHTQKHTHVQEMKGRFLHRHESHVIATVLKIPSKPIPS